MLAYRAIDISFRTCAERFEIVHSFGLDDRKSISVQWKCWFSLFSMLMTTFHDHELILSQSHVVGVELFSIIKY